MEVDISSQCCSTYNIPVLIVDKHPHRESLLMLSLLSSSNSTFHCPVVMSKSVCVPLYICPVPEKLFALSLLCTIFTLSTDLSLLS